MIHDYTPPTADVADWLDSIYPEGDVVVQHTADCDLRSHGDECIGGCPVVDAQ